MIALLASLSYIGLVHAAALTGRVELRYAALVLLVGLALYALRALPRLQLVLAAALAAVALLARDGLVLLLYAPPVLVPLLLAALFGRTLAPGRQPLIERIVWHLHGRPERLSDRHISYTRAVTVYWCAMFVLMAAVNGVLGLLAPPALWSWVGNIGTYLLPPVALLAEYAWRKRVFPVQQYRNVFDYLWRIVRMGPTFAAELARNPLRSPADAPPAVPG